MKSRTFSLCINDVLPRAVLVLILRHCWRNTRTIMLVCRAWHSICTTEIEYWRLAYYNYLYPRLPATMEPKLKQTFFKVFHTFDNEFFPTFGEKVGWLFIHGAAIFNLMHQTVDSKNFKFYIELQRFYIHFCVKSIALEIAIKLTENDKRGKLYVEKVLFIDDSVTSGHSYAKQTDLDSPYYEEIEYFDKEKDLKWRGTGIQQIGKDSTHAHPIPSGDGTWSRLSTGEVLLSGKDVAHRGLMDDDGKTYHRGKRIKIENEG